MSHAARPKPGLTVVGNLAVDRVDGGPPSAGGCPAFALTALARLGAGGEVLTRRAPGDAPLFSGLRSPAGVGLTVLDASRTSGFELDYSGEQRTMRVTAIGDSWSAEQLAAASTAWVHAAPLLRGEFPLAALLRLSTGGRRVSFDGQGLVRLAQLGPLRLDDHFDPGLLAALSVLKLADEEAAVVARRGRFGLEDAQRLGVPEILVTFGSAGADLYCEGRRVRVTPSRRVAAVQSTGAGDMFAVTYAAARAGGVEPQRAAQAACELVADVLAERLAGA